MFVILFAQAAAAVPSSLVGPPVPRRCEEIGSRSDEVVVCAARPRARSPYRIELPAADQTGLGKAEVSVGNGAKIAAETETADVGGFPSKRAMIRLKVAF